MKTLHNTHQNARLLAVNIIQSGVVPCFDLDGVLIDASHRQNVYNKADYIAGRCSSSDIGVLNLSKYRENSTAEKIARDQAMPLLAAVKILNQNNIGYHVVTARVACMNTRKLLLNMGITPLSIMSRESEQDHRRDARLKTDHLVKFDQRQRENMMLIDDNKKNCLAVQAIGLKAIHVPFEGH